MCHWAWFPHSGPGWHLCIHSHVCPAHKEVRKEEIHNLFVVTCNVFKGLSSGLIFFSYFFDVKMCRGMGDGSVGRQEEVSSVMGVRAHL